MPDSTSNITGGLPPPPGVIPNFIDPYSKAWYSILTIVVCLTLTTLLIGIRICTKFLITKSHGWEDCEYKLSRSLLPLTDLQQTRLLLLGYKIFRLILPDAYSLEDEGLLLNNAQLGFVCYSILGFEELQYGWGVNQWNVPLQDVIKFAQVIILVVYVRVCAEYRFANR